MKTEFKDVAHLYKDIKIMSGEFYLTVQWVLRFGVVADYDIDGQRKTFGFEDIKPILRPLSDITDEEVSHWTDLYEPGVHSMKKHAIRTLYLLNQHFDLFDLIESGQAIDKTKL